MTFRPHAGAIALAALAVALPAAATSSYHLVDLGVESWPGDINRKGEISGLVNYTTALYTDDAWHVKNDRHHDSAPYAIDDGGNMIGEEQDRDGAFTLMYYPKGAKDFAIPRPAGADPAQTFADVPGGLSPDGQRVAATYKPRASSYTHCFVWHPGDATSTDIGLPPGYDACNAWDVNDAGEIVGQVVDQTHGTTSSFLYRDGAFEFVGTGGFEKAFVFAINRKGHAIGNYADAAAWWNGRHLRKIPATGDLRMESAAAIDDRDEIVGTGVNGSFVRTLAMVADGVIVDLVPLIDNPAGWDFNDVTGGPSGIDERGEITGTAKFDDGSGPQYHGFVLVPND
jgi:hypothetical protein